MYGPLRCSLVVVLLIFLVPQVGAKQEAHGQDLDMVSHGERGGRSHSDAYDGDRLRAHPANEQGNDASRPRHERHEPTVEPSARSAPRFGPERATERTVGATPREDVPGSPGPAASSTPVAVASEAVPVPPSPLEAPPATRSSTSDGPSMPAPHEAPVAMSGPPESEVQRLKALVNGTRPPAETTVVPDGMKAPSTGAPWLIWGAGAVFGAGLGMVAIRSLLRRGGNRPERATSASQEGATVDPVTNLLERVQKVPYDAMACFDLAVHMLKTGAVQEGLRYLDRSFHLDPGLILRLLKDESCAPVLHQAPVRQLLLRIKRDQDHRAWSGYA